VQILAISLDLDDTLWPVEPAILNAERCLDAWLRERHPSVAATWPIPAMRELREAMSRERPDLSHDFTAQRLLTLARAFAACGVTREHVAPAFDVYYAARNTDAAPLESGRGSMTPAQCTPSATSANSVS